MTDVVVVDEQDNIIGSMPKADAHRDGTLHRIAVIYVENDSGEILVQSRVDGYLDHSAAGHVDVGESYEQAARRELFEELGIKKDPLEHIGHGKTHNELIGDAVVSHVFDIFTCIGEPKVLQEDEVADVYWAKPEDVWADMQENKEKYCEGFIVSLKIFREARNM